MLNVLIMIVVLAVGGVLLMPRLARAPLWQATITPLASIIGSGFLVIGPILHASFGYLSPLVMAALCAGAYLYGAAIRYNIAAIAISEAGAESGRSAVEAGLEVIADWALAFAYVISVAYYLNLFGAFGLSLTNLDDPFHARLLTSGVFLVILGVGWAYGFKALERMEQVTVGIKLAIIAGLLFGLGWYFVGKLAVGTLVMVPAPVGGWAGVTLVFGLLVTVQGFETSRYLGDEYDARTRIHSMRIAQGLSAVIYMIYIGFLTYSFDSQAFDLSETAIIQLMGIVAPILSVLLVAAALSAQFSAAVADAGGSGGLIGELTGHRVQPRMAYAGLVAAGLVLTWGSNVFDIIGYASRAFAVYYGLQAVIAARTAWRRGARGYAAGFAALAVLGAVIAVFGTSVE
ncbi:MAG: hypothetical protein ACI8R4_000636 [Paracoccaceae bacterium]|jgi:hypothetical protein